ncbi:MAG: xanthine dehydrogenase family protein molybdopterin-binding subunit [Hyphomicrobiaceae bacterium]
MSRVGTIARRAFLIGSATVAGGVAFGYYLATKPVPNPLLADLKDGEASITPFVKIDANGITLITPHADKGQGTTSLQAYLIAEELDVDPMKVTLSPGEPAQAYYNKVAFEDAAPFPAYEHTWLSEQVRGALGGVARIMAIQMTGGSTTARNTYHRLRHAGAVARETLKEAAAKKLGVARTQLKTADGHVIAPDGKKIAYTALAAEAAKIEPVVDVTLRDPKSWRYLGKRVERTDIVAKSTGTQTYGIDVRIDGMLHATVRANPGVGGSVIKYDAAKAEKMRGVKKIAPISHGVAVIADNTWRAFKAAEAIDIEWGPGPYPATSKELWEKMAACRSEAFRDSRARDDGDVEIASATGSVITADYRVPYLAHGALEPMNAVVKVGDDRVDIWTGTQIPSFVRDHAAKLTGLDAAEIHVHSQMIGGSFGRRLEDTAVMQAVEVAMAMKGTAVQMTWSREEDFSHDYPRPAQLGYARGTVKNGKVQSFDLDCVGQSMARSWFGRLMMAPPGPDMYLVAGAWDQPYAIPNYRVTGYAVPEMIPVSSWRSPGYCANAFLHESFLDELIHAAGADPLEERLRLLTDKASRRVLEAVGKLCEWTGPKIGENRGRGVAFNFSMGVPCAEVIEVTNSKHGIRIDKAFVVVEAGRALDPVNFEAQMTGGLIFGLGHAMNCELTYKNYMPEQTNFDSYQAMRLDQTPEIVVQALEDGNGVRGIGEPTLPPAAPALANAIFAATGKRVRELPLSRHIRFP